MQRAGSVSKKTQSLTIDSTVCCTTFCDWFQLTTADRDSDVRQHRRHRGSEVFLTSFWGMKTGEDDIKRAALLENLGERVQPGRVMSPPPQQDQTRELLDTNRTSGCRRFNCIQFAEAGWPVSCFCKVVSGAVDTSSRRLQTPSVHFNLRVQGSRCCISTRL